MRKFDITYSNRINVDLENRNLSWDKFIQLMKDSSKTSDVEGMSHDEIEETKVKHSAFTTSKINGSTARERKNENVESISMLKLDIDKSDIEMDDLKQNLESLQCDYLLNTTFSHTINDNKNYRVIIPLSKDIVGTEEEMSLILKAVTQKVTEKLDASKYLDIASYTISQVMFTPHYRKGINDNVDIVSKSQGQYLEVSDYIDVDDVLNQAKEEKLVVDEIEGTGNSLSCEQIIDKISTNRQADKFNKLFYGVDLSEDEKDSSHSELDQSLINILAWWTNSDIKKMDELFKQSILYRDKWDRKDYAERTMKKAIKLIDGKGWKDTFPYVNDKNVPFPIWENLDHLLEQNGITLRFNQMSREIDVDGLDSSVGYDAMATDVDSLCTLNGFKLGGNQLTNFMHRIAMENQHHPVKEYFEESHSNYVDDGVDYLGQLFETLNVKNNTEFNELLFRKFFIQTVALAFNEDGETQSAGVLVLQGEQGIGKGRWVNSLLPTREWIKCDLSLDPKDKDSVIRATSSLIAELGELETTTTRREQGILKSFITSTNDSYRVPYGRNNETFPRRTSFIGTVNQAEFLKDDTGNRRWWILELDDKDINVDHGIDLSKLWGQVTQMFKDGTPHWLVKEEIAILNNMNNKHRILNGVEQNMRDLYDWDMVKGKEGTSWNWKSASEINIDLGIGTNTNVSNGKEISNAYDTIMLEFGYTKKQLTLANKEFKKRMGAGTTYRVPRKINLYGSFGEDQRLTKTR